MMEQQKLQEACKEEIQKVQEARKLRYQLLQEARKLKQEAGKLLLKALKLLQQEAWKQQVARKEEQEAGKLMRKTALELLKLPEARNEEQEAGKLKLEARKLMQQEARKLEREARKLELEAWKLMQQAPQEARKLQEAWKEEMQVHQIADLRKQLHELQAKITDLSEKQDELLKQLPKNLLELPRKHSVPLLPTPPKDKGDKVLQQLRKDRPRWHRPTVSLIPRPPYSEEDKVLDKGQLPKNRLRWHSATPHSKKADGILGVPVPLTPFMNLPASQEEMQEPLESLKHLEESWKKEKQKLQESQKKKQVYLNTVLAEARYGNTAESSDELTFRKGDILTVMEQNVAGSVGWWNCSLHGRQGLAPANRLLLLTPSQVEALCPDKPCSSSMGSPPRPGPKPRGSYRCIRSPTCKFMEDIYDSAASSSCFPSATLSALWNPVTPSKSSLVEVADDTFTVALWKRHGEVIEVEILKHGHEMS